PPGSQTVPYDSSMATTGSQGQSEALCVDYGTSAIAKDLWYTWTSTMSGTVTVTTCGLMTLPSANADTKIAAYPGARCPTSAAIACNDDEGHSPAMPVYTCAAGNFNSTIMFTATCGQTYTLQIGQYPFNTTNIAGAFQITESGSPCTPGTAFCAGDGM